MGKIFKLALEEAVETQPEVVQDIPVDELVNNAEELAKTDAEIQQDVQAVEDLMEEKAVLEEQVEKNEELLSNPDAVVSTVDVEVSEECRDKVHYFLGYDSSIGKIRLSSESMYDDVKSNPRKYLAISNEDIKETIKKIWEKIKAFFKKIWDKIKAFFRKLGLKVKMRNNEVAKEKETVKENIKNNPNLKSKKMPAIEAIKSKRKGGEVATEAVANDVEMWSRQYDKSPYLIYALLDTKEFEKVINYQNWINYFEKIKHEIDTLCKSENAIKLSILGEPANDTEFNKWLTKVMSYSPFAQSGVVYDEVINAINNVSSNVKVNKGDRIFAVGTSGDIVIAPRVSSPEFFGDKSLYLIFGQTFRHEKIGTIYPPVVSELAKKDLDINFVDRCLNILASKPEDIKWADKYCESITQSTLNNAQAVIEKISKEIDLTEQQVANIQKFFVRLNNSITRTMCYTLTSSADTLLDTAFRMLKTIRANLVAAE